MIEYTSAIAGITPDRLDGFFAGWPNPPSKERHLEILERSAVVVLAVDSDSRRVVGFITAITDGILTAYIPLLEVLPGWQGRGIGRTLVQRMLDALDGFYMTDLLCDPALQPFYSKLGMTEASGMMLRRYGKIGGREEEYRL